MAEQRPAEFASNSPERVAIFAPLGRDGPLTASALLHAGFEVCLCADARELIECIEAGSGALVMTVEALECVDLRALREQLRRQPPWSDLPVILLSGERDHMALERAVGALGNVTSLYRPVVITTLIAAVRSALRQRLRQFEVRYLLIKSEMQQAHIEALNERLRRAMTETHHRVKNNLQVIAALIDMQVLEDTTSVPVEEFQRLGSHVSMLSTLHDLLTAQSKADTSVDHVSAREMLGKLAPLLQMIAPERPITYAADEILIPVRQATSLTMLLNEAVSNAIKHGLGTIHVSLAAHDGRAWLEVTDEGPGFPPDFDAARSANTGLELLNNLSSWDLGGEVAYENRPNGGARVVVTFSVESELPLSAQATDDLELLPGR